MRTYESIGDWKFKVDRKEDFKELVRKRGHYLYELANPLGMTKAGVTAKFNSIGSPWFTERQVQVVSRFLKMTRDEVHDFFISLHKEVFTPEWMTEKELRQPPTGCFKSGNGFEFRYILNGKVHSSYGATEVEARKNAETRQKKQEVPKVETEKTERAELKISKEEALVLVDQLFHDVVGEQVKPECKSTIQSIYWRLTTQFMV